MICCFPESSLSRHCERREDPGDEVVKTDLEPAGTSPQGSAAGRISHRNGQTVISSGFSKGGATLYRTVSE